ncbi:MAG: gliding motility lipoprotein GldB [Cytophagaceae bacterium]
MFKRAIFPLVFAAMLFSCNGDNTSEKKKEVMEAAKTITVDLKYQNLSETLFNHKTKEEIRSFLLQHPTFCNEFLEIPSAHSDERMVEFIHQLYSNEHLRKFYQQTEEKFSKEPLLKDQLTSMFRHLKHHFPDASVPEVNTIVTGFKFNKDLSVSDSLIVISTDYFLGPEAEFRPVIYNYFLERYDRPYLVPMIAMAISNKYNEVNTKDETMLAHMIYHGKTLYFMESVLPETPDSLIIMYSGQTVKDVEENVDVIWAHFIEKKLLFETAPRIIEKYIGESPKISEIGEKCPGRIGRWLGWQIIRKYMNQHPELTLADLMKEKDANKIFRESKYKPK